MAAYKEQKDKRLFIKRRTKLIKSQWRNGIVGIEDTQGGDEREEEQVLQPIDKTKIRRYFDRLEERKDSKCSTSLKFQINYLFQLLINHISICNRVASF